MHFSQNPIAIGQADLVSSATQAHYPGQEAVTPDGRRFRYALAGAVDLVAGNWIQSPAWETLHGALVPSAAAIGATSITVTLGNAAAAANRYAQGLAIISLDPGLGYSYPISGHPAADASASLTVSLDASHPIQVALTATSDVDLIANPYRGVIQGPATTMTGVCVGVATYILTADQWGWLCVGGHCGALIEDTPALGVQVAVPSDTAGQLVVASGTLQTVGFMLATGVDDRCKGVFLTMP